MANFCSVPQEERISEITLPNSMSPGVKATTIGLWGFLDFQGNELQILAPPYLQITKGLVKGKTRLYQISSYHPGRWSLEAVTASGESWDTLTVFVKTLAGEPTSGHKYTTNPQEVATRKTVPPPRDVVSLLMRAWSQLTELGARTLTAQFMLETTEGNNCYNWNLGNVKEPTGRQSHMYLKGVWECTSASEAQRSVEQSNGLAHIATAEEIRKHGWACAVTVVVFEPPHAASRFRAYDSLEEGAQRWITRHQGIAERNPGYLTSLNQGDITAVAHALRQVGYYTAPENNYAIGMTREKKRLDQLLGTLP